MRRLGFSTADVGTTFEHTFEEPVSYRSVCEPHAEIVAIGAIEAV